MRHKLLLVALAAAVAAAAPASAEVRLTMADGHVSISATNATVGQILAEWARVGQTRIVNGERLTGGPLTLELTNVPEAQALDIILRSASGYLLAPRPTPVPTASRFDRILILPTSSAPRAAAAPPPPPSFPPPRPAVVIPQDPDEPDPQPDRPAFVTFPPPGAFQAPGAFPQPGIPSNGVEPEAIAPPPSRFPTGVGVARPGMIVPAPPVQAAPQGNPQ